jgi:hypothetical protein
VRLPHPLDARVSGEISCAAVLKNPYVPLEKLA